MNPFIQLARHPVRFRLFLLTKLPAALFSGVKMKSISGDECEVTVPYSWFSKNPFRSTYFACLAMGAEMSTGALALSHVYKRQPAVSMLPTEMRSTFHKKATGLTTFICRDGKVLRDAVEAAVASGSSQAVTVQSTGINELGEVVAVFHFTWSFKVKQR